MKLNLFNIFVKEPPTLPVPVRIENHFGKNYIKSLPVQCKDEIVLMETFPTEEIDSARTVIKSLRNQELGTHDYNLFTDSKELDGEIMEVKSFARNRGLGEILRLASIMEMKENNMKRIGLVSLSEAVKFHAKYGFDAKLADPAKIITILWDIKKQYKFTEFENKATQFLKDIFNDSSWHYEQEKINNINAFISDCIRRSDEPPVFSNTISMVLTEEKVNANADFYNELFKSHKIDYKI